MVDFWREGANNTLPAFRKDDQIAVVLAYVTRVLSSIRKGCSDGKKLSPHPIGLNGFYRKREIMIILPTNSVECSPNVRLRHAPANYLVHIVGFIISRP